MSLVNQAFPKITMQSLNHQIIELLDRNDFLHSTLLLGKIQDSGFVSSPYQDKVLEIAAEIWNLTARSKYDAVEKATGIARVLFDRVGVTGKTEGYKNLIDDPSRLYLHLALDGKETSPIILACLYLILAEQVGLECHCYALPTQYFIHVEDATGGFYVDPFDRGKFLTPEEFKKKVRKSLNKSRMVSASLYEKITRDQLIGRIAQQLKHVYILKGKALEALRAVEVLTAIYPGSPELTRDRGILYCEIEYFSKAVDDLRYYLKARPEAEDVREIKKLAKMLRGFKEIIN